jgi:hypothetical protein
MTTSTSASADLAPIILDSGSRVDPLRLAAAAYLARYQGT